MTKHVSTHLPPWMLSSAAAIILSGCGAASGGPGAPGGPGGVTVIASAATSDPSGIAVDGSGIYWMDVDQGVDASNVGRIMKASLDGSSITTLASGQHLFTGDIDEITAIALDETSVYWTSEGNGMVMKINKDGSGLTVLARGQAASSIAVDATSVYWTNQYNEPDGNVTRVAKDGSHLTVLVTGVDNPVGIQVDGTGIYWAGPFDGSVNRAGLDGSNHVVLTQVQGGTNYLALDGTQVYFTAGGDTVMSVAKGGGRPFLIAQNQDGPLGIAVDGSRVYWTISDNQGRVMSAGKDGSDVSTFALGLSYLGCYGITLDQSSVYWTCFDGTVLKKAK